MGLSSDSYGQSAGQLKIETNYPGLLLAKPEGLQPFLGAGAEKITNNVSGVLRQIRTTQLLADIIVSNDFRYDVKFYTAGNFSTNKTNGLYPPTGQPFQTITVENPDASVTTYSRLRLTENGDLGNRQYEYEWATGDQMWELTSGGGLRKETRTVGWSGAIRTETNEVKNADGTVVFKQIEKFKAFAWGETNLIERIVDPTGQQPLTNTWVYYDSTGDGNNYKHLKLQIEPSGHWERFEYTSGARVIKKVSQFGNVATNGTESQCFVTTNDYSSSSVIDVPPPPPQITTVVKLLNQEIGRSYRADFPGGTSNIVCQTSGASWTASDNLVTVTSWYTNGPFAGNTKSVKSPDGTISLFRYAISADGLSKITTNFVGAGDETAITNGTRTITTVDLAGNVMTNETYDVGSGLLLSRSLTVSNDFLGRPQTVVELDGTNTTSYSCCGIASTTDKEGIVTDYQYDALKRVSTTAHAGITISNSYDAAGRVLLTARNGVTQAVNVYDKAGRLLSSTNALQHGTTYTETRNANGCPVRTTTNPDSSTRVETYSQDGQLTNVTGTAVHGVRYEYGVELDSGVYRKYTKEIRLNAAGTDTSEWTKTYFDMLDRAYKTVNADGSYSQSYFNNKGQLWKQRDPDGVVTLFAYNDRDELETTAIDMNRNDVIDYNGTDRITRTQNTVLTAHGITVRRMTTSVWTNDNVDASLTMSVDDVSGSGLQSWQISFGLTNQVQTTYDRASARRAVATTNPDGSFSISGYQNGRLQTVTNYFAGGALLATLSYQYDGVGRQSRVTDARGVTTAFAYDVADQVVGMTNAVGATEEQITQYSYDTMGRQLQVTLPDNGTMNFTYYSTGERAFQYGAHTYPVAYAYDYAGRLSIMQTWQDAFNNTGTAQTTWNYDPLRGFLTSKVYADNSSVTYSNTAAGRLLSRKWARNITATYAYNTAGDIGTITYSDSTPGATFGYDRRGRRTTAVDNAGTHTMSYNDAGQLLTESFPNSGASVTNAYDSLLRRSSLSGIGVLPVQYTYDAASRLSTAGNATHSATYVYLPNSSLVSNIVFATGGGAVMVTEKSYDNLNRLRSVSNFGGGGGPSSLSENNRVYIYNDANQRARVDLGDGSYWLYNYGALGQVISGKRNWPDGTAVAGQQFEYGFDDIGNRKTTTINSRTGTYTANSLNQYTQRTVPGTVDVLGTATSDATVTVNNQATQRKGEYFYKQLSVSNTTAAVYTNVWVVGVRKNAGTNQQDVVTEVTGHEFVPKTPEIFSYDSDGNLTNDGRWVYTWDAENRLIGVETAVSAVTASAPKQKLLFGYDYQSRRISKVVSNRNGAAWSEISNLRFVYDNWNLIAELDKTNTPARSYVWGLDLSGTEQGAGGVGGLLALTSYSSPQSTHFVVHDGNGNVVALVNPDGGFGAEVSAQYEYSPFGETIRATGLAASVNPFRFSSKYADAETGLLYYGYRYYQPNTGRWPSRDPAEEQGGQNLYVFILNDPPNNIDLFGLLMGPAEIKALDKNYPDTAVQTYSTTASSCWRTSGHLAIKGSNLGTSIKVYATGESTTSGDSIIKAINFGGTETLAVTVRRPKWLSRPSGLTPTTSSAFGIVGYDLRFRWKIEDQFHSPLAGVPVSESLATLARYHVLGLHYVTGSAVTDSTGTVADHYSLFFAGRSGYLYNQQTIIVGNWQASVINMLFANGGFGGNLVSVFH